MSNSREDHFDRALKEAIQEDFVVPELSSREAWENLAPLLKHSTMPRDGKRKDRKRWVYIFSTAAIFFIVLFASPSGTIAYGKLTEIVYVITNNNFKTNLKVSDNESDLTDIPNFEEVLPADRMQPNIHHVTFSEAQEAVSFDIKVPKYIPPSFSQSLVSLVEYPTQQSHEVILNYEGSGKMFLIKQQKITDSFSSSGSMFEGNIQYEERMINGFKATIIQYDDGFIEISWATQNQYYLLRGNLEENILLEIASSIY